MTTRALTLGAALALVASVATPADAYVREQSNWNPASLPIPYRVNLSTAPASLGATTAQAAIDNGMATWAAPTCTRWRSTNAGTTTLTRGRTGDRENSFLWISGSWPAELGGVDSTIGITTPVWNVGGYFIDADIQFNNVGFTWSTTGTRGTVDAQSIATHEEGHFLGLDHTTVRGAVMYPSYSSGLVRTLSSDDIAGVCAIYPSGGPVPDAGTTTPDAGTSTDPCARFTSCAGCTPINGCGWCGASNSCVSGTPTGPASGTCASGYAWVPMDCTGSTTPDASTSPDVGTTTDPCARFTTCGGCTPVNGCGWCGATNSCVSGTQTGPVRGACASGYAWLPSDCGGTTAPPAGTAAFGEPCRQPADCASGGLCVGTSSTTAFCSRVCVDDCSCPRGYRCAGRLSTGQTVCIPGTNTCSTTPVDAGTADVPPPPDVPVTQPDVPTPIDRPTVTDAPAPGDDVVVVKDAATPDDASPDDASLDDVANVDAAGADGTTNSNSGSGSSAGGCRCSVPGAPTLPPSRAVVALAFCALALRRRRRA